jgi:nucleoside-diphosphate-sugar epimerase
VRVLLTGSSGRVGRAVRDALADRGHAVVGFDRVGAPGTDFVADLRDDAALRSAMKSADAVVHTAGLHAPHVGQVPDADFEAVNVDATRRLLLHCAEFGIGRLVYTSTTALYGQAATPAEAAGWVTEDTPPQPRTVYHRSKLAAEALLREAAAGGRLRVTVLRMSRCFPEAAPLMAAYRLHRGVDARDVATAHARALVPDATDAPAYRCFVVSSPTPFRAEDAAALKHDAPAVIAQRAPELASAFAARGWALPRSIDRVYASDAAQRELGWRPRFGPDEVLRQFDAGSPEVLGASTGR